MAHRRPQKNDFEAKNKINSSKHPHHSKNKIDKDTLADPMGGGPCGREGYLYLFFLFAMVRVLGAFFILFCFKIVFLGPPVSHFLFVLLRNTFLEVKILFFASKIMFFSYFFIFATGTYFLNPPFA